MAHETATRRAGGVDRALRSLAAFMLCALVAWTARAGEAPAHGQKANRLIASGSAYLLQHAYNPVDWYPWGDEAFERARRENKPIFVSVGYSSCYWCHVANRTLYSNPEIAALMNRWFVNVKVDREQRPDIDAIYMRATGIMTGRGGWPNNLFLTPEGKPFFGGSYFPPEDDDFGRPGFVTVLRTIHEAWAERPEQLQFRAERVLTAMQAQSDSASPARIDPAAWLGEARRRIAARFDAKHAGFPIGDSPSQFPLEPTLALLLESASKPGAPALADKLSATLDAIALGGVHDHVGGGFFRYSVDRAWSVPHFEKMLTTNAQLLGLYAEAWQRTRRPLYRQVALDAARYLERRMRSPQGGFYTAEDAEVEGHEGASYLWTEVELATILGDAEAKKFLRHFQLVPLATTRAVALDKSQEGGALRFRTPLPSHEAAAEIYRATAEQRAKLLAARERRKQPRRDDTLIVSLNGLAIEAFARAGRRFGDARLTRVARETAEHLWPLVYQSAPRRLRHAVFEGRAQGEGFLDDYALLALGFLELAQATGEAVWRERAARLADDLLARFSRSDGSLAMSLAEQRLIIRPEEAGDRVQPSGVSAAVALLLRLDALRPSERYRDAARRIVTSMSARIAADPDDWPLLVAATAGAGLDVKAAAAISPGDTAALVSAQATLARKGEHDELVVRLRIAKGFHVNANPATHDYLIPTELHLEGAKPLRIAYPKGRLFRPGFARSGIQVYDDGVRILATVPKGGAARGHVRAQACNDEVCLPPANIPLTVTR